MSVGSRGVRVAGPPEPRDPDLNRPTRADDKGFTVGFLGTPKLGSIDTTPKTYTSVAALPDNLAPRFRSIQTNEHLDSLRRPWG